jgi:hypothetical protein
VCETCGRTWEPKLRGNGDVKPGWYVCPNGCNEDLLMPDPERVFRELGGLQRPAPKKPGGNKK